MLKYKNRTDSHIKFMLIKEFKNQEPQSKFKIKTLRVFSSLKKYSVLLLKIQFQQLINIKIKFYLFFYTSLHLKDKLLCYLSTVKIPRPLTKALGRIHFLKTKSYVFDKQINYTSRIHIN